VSVPIETHGKQRDGIGIREVVGPTAGRQELHSTAELREQVRRCRTVVTGSYHAAVFALAAGVPVVCLSKSSYYDQKFSGLAALMPAGAVTLVRLSEGTDGLAPAVASAWELGRAHREAVLACARELGTRSQDLWREVCASLN
jgi:colanic acid/amylovoran biosynthesis protein